MVTPDNLDQVLAALKYAGVTRARFGDVEFEFAPEVHEEPTAPQMPVLEAVPAKQDAPSVPTRPGYAQLFGPEVPRFRPAE